MATTTVVEDIKSPQDRLTALTAVISKLQEGFATDFTEWDRFKLPSPAHYFRLSYSEVIRTLRLITEEDWKPDSNPKLKPELHKLFDRGTDLLSSSITYAKKAGVSLRPVHKALLSDVRHLCERRDINGTNGLAIHVIKMLKQLQDIRPPAGGAWTVDGTDLKPDAEFDLIFEEFCDLDNQKRKFQGDHERFARNSWRLLQGACEALHLTEGETQPSDDFFNNDTRPTYVEFSCKSKEFLYGKEGRPGILSVKAKLGAPLTTDQQNKIRMATKKRRARLSLQDSQEAPTHTTKNYSMKLVNAVADIQDVLRDSQLLSPKNEHIPRPSTESLMTPTLENRKDILFMDRGDLSDIIDNIYTRKFSMPMDEANLPSSPGERKDWLRLAGKEINAARASVKRYMDVSGSASTAKELRLSAYKLKLARSLFMLGLLSGTPAASPAEVQKALRERLEDWIVHEQAWNAVDRYLLAQNQQTCDSIQQHIEGRNSNIIQWRQLRGELTNPFSLENKTKDNNKNQQNKKEDSLSLTENQIRTSKILLNSVLVPRIPDTSEYVLDVREERRRRTWFQKMALARLTGESVPEWTHKKVVDPFAAGGPPDWETLPCETRWDRLEYMWVMTFWRFYQLKELEL
ncbi:hypothetical protein F4678DRAFT_473710 [Xylaria arbuscula]|nr:hypothetical protein F4678DRAFT_473710 [Xylaria arbuscula]